MNESSDLAVEFEREYTGINNSGRNIKTTYSFEKIHSDFSVFYDNGKLNFTIFKKEAFYSFYQLFDDSIKIFKVKYDAKKLNDNQKKQMKIIFDKYLCMMSYLCAITKTGTGLYSKSLEQIIVSLLELPRNIGRGVIFRVFDYLVDNKSTKTLTMFKKIIFYSQRIKIPDFNKKTLSVNRIVNHSVNNIYNKLMNNNNMKNNFNLKEKKIKNNQLKQKQLQNNQLQNNQLQKLEINPQGNSPNKVTQIKNNSTVKSPLHQSTNFINNLKKINLTKKQNCKNAEEYTKMHPRLCSLPSFAKPVKCSCKNII
jgi:hypothetical protein